MLFFNPKTKWFSLRGVWQEFWSFIWNISEYTGYGLGRFSPWVFGQMIGGKKIKMPKKDKEMNR